MSLLSLPTWVAERATGLLLDLFLGQAEDFDYTPMTYPTSPSPTSQPREPIGVSGAAYVAGFRPCQYCGDHISHYGLCPRISSIEYDQYGQVKRVQFREVNHAA